MGCCYFIIAASASSYGFEAQKARLVELEAEVQPLQVQEVADDMSLLAVRIIKASLFMGVGCAFLGGVLSDFSYLGPIIGACIGVVLGAASEYRFGLFIKFLSWIPRA